MHIEFFIIEEVHVLGNLIVVDKLTKVVLWRPQAEVLKTDLLGWIVSESIVEHKSLLFELKASLLWTYSDFTQRLRGKELIPTVCSIVGQLHQTEFNFVGSCESGGSENHLDHGVAREPCRGQ